MPLVFSNSKGNFFPSSYSSCFFSLKARYGITINLKMLVEEGGEMGNLIKKRLEQNIIICFSNKPLKSGDLPCLFRVLFPSVDVPMKPSVSTAMLTSAASHPSKSLKLHLRNAGYLSDTSLGWWRAKAPKNLINSKRYKREKRDKKEKKTLQNVKFWIKQQGRIQGGNYYLYLEFIGHVHLFY